MVSVTMHKLRVSKVRSKVHSKVSIRALSRNDREFSGLPPIYGPGCLDRGFSELDFVLITQRVTHKDMRRVQGL